jgi:hypothetical protein
VTGLADLQKELQALVEDLEKSLVPMKAQAKK